MERKAYLIVARYWISHHPYCEYVTENGVPICMNEATQIHHMKGCIGRLLCDERWFLAVCDTHHKWIEDHKNEARQRGLIRY